jgi:hypothetical protein
MKRRLHRINVEYYGQTAPFDVDWAQPIATFIDRIFQRFTLLRLAEGSYAMYWSRKGLSGTCHLQLLHHPALSASYQISFFFPP